MVVAVLPLACERRAANPPNPANAQAAERPVPLPPGVSLRFENVTRAAGIEFTHFDGRTPMQYIMDQLGAGLGWLDYDQDGWMDLFLVQGHTVDPAAPPPSPAPTCKLFRNLGGLGDRGGKRFQDVTAQTGVGHVGCGQGVAVGDINNDGFPDLFVTCYGKPNAFYLNVPGPSRDREGVEARVFADISARSGLGEHPDWKERPNYSTSAAFLDFDHDGFLDLFVCSYVKIDLKAYPDCRDAKGRRGACPPSAFEGTRCVLYRNNGNLTFTDVTKDAGVDAPNAKALGVAALDFNDDGLVDLFVANDSVPNFLFLNSPPAQAERGVFSSPLPLGGEGAGVRGFVRFEECALLHGCAVNLAGNPQAYMGVDADDLDGDGRPDLFATAFARETNTFFRNLGGLGDGCRFLDWTQGSGLGPPSWHRLGFGAAFADLDRDGALDIVVANGHVFAQIDDEGDPNNSFRQQAQMFLNDGKGRFRDVSPQAGQCFAEKHVGRGLASCDFDNDGRIDLAFSNSGGAPVLLHNQSTTPGHWIRLELRGARSNRDAVGAKVTLRLGERKLVRHRKGGGSYCSACDPRLLIGLGAASRVDQIEIRWPSGLVETLGPLHADRGYLIIEGQKQARELGDGGRS